MAEWEAVVDQRMKEAVDPEVAEAADPEIEYKQAPEWLCSAWWNGRAGLDAITYTSLAEFAGRTIEEVKAAWLEAGLPERPARPRIHPLKPGLSIAIVVGLLAHFSDSPSLAGVQGATSTDNILSAFVAGDWHGLGYW